MAFEAEIGINKHKLMWSKTIASLAAIADNITFTITEEYLSLSTNNISKTTHAEIIFKKGFFSKYSVDFSNILPDGYSKGDDKAELSYSFLVNSRHLTTVFKGLDSHSMKYACIRINWSQDAPANLKYKLFIEMKTKKLIVKKFQTSYTPATKHNMKVASAYKLALYGQKDDDDAQDPNRINHIVIDQVIPKQFLEMVPAAAEDFKVDIKADRLVFCGYTKLIMKDRDYLKQPMSVSVTIGLDELTDTNLGQQPTGEKPVTRLINFGMRDFKNFLNLVGFFNSLSSYSEQLDEDFVTVAHNDYFHIFFRNPGDPILFDLQNNPNVEVQYIQITAEDKAEMSTTEVSVDVLRKDLVIEASVPLKVNKEAFEASRTPSFIKPVGRTTFGKPVIAIIPTTSESGVSEDQSQGFDAGITYDQESDQQEAKRGDETDYSDATEEDEETEEPPRKRILIDELGPTQLTNKAKSIF
ncbi:DNA damage checkpoint protein 1 [Candida viswanathii]|uniref:DNA damage checkpoint protein 1 n=1 Tax=Candida viswanathii TaxID=5486 RepID=A0A367XVS6_9ASCO|nr:DNA damage checkpoint protein 1 [Candida viswanathii]